VIPKIEMSDWQATLAAYRARICSVLFDNREMGMLVKLATLSTQVRAGIQGTVSDEVIREKRLMFKSQTISRSPACEVDLLLVQRCLICLAVWRLGKTVDEIRCKGRAKTGSKVPRPAEAIPGEPTNEDSLSGICTHLVRRMGETAREVPATLRLLGGVARIFIRISLIGGCDTR
jgi:hypothetical protein